MKRIIQAIGIFVLLIAAAQAQDWVNKPYEELEFSCGYMSIITVSYGHFDLVRDETGVTSLLEYFEERVLEGCTMDSGQVEQDEAARWALGPDGESEWNCAIIDKLALTYPTWSIIRQDGIEYTLAEYFETLAPACIDEDRVAGAIATRVHVPTWARESTGHYEVNCETLRAISDHYGTRDFWRDGDTVIAFRDLYHRIAWECFKASARDDDQETREPYVLAARASYLRDCAGSSCAIAGRVPEGAALTVHGESSGWYHVSFGQRSGYIASWLTRPDKQSQRWEQASYHALVTQGSVLRDCASKTCDPIGKAHAGTVYEVIDSLDGWREVLVDGGTAFIDSLAAEAGPGSIIGIEDSVRVDGIDCIVSVWNYNSGGQLEISFVQRAGPDVGLRVDFYRPADRYTLQLVDPALKTLAERVPGTTSQMYRSYADFRPGLYIVEIEMNGNVGRVGFNAPETKGYEINAYC